MSTKRATGRPISYSTTTAVYVISVNIYEIFANLIQYIYIYIYIYIYVKFILKMKISVDKKKCGLAPPECKYPDLCWRFFFRILFMLNRQKSRF